MQGLKALAHLPSNGSGAEGLLYERAAGVREPGPHVRVRSDVSHIAGRLLHVGIRPNAPGIVRLTTRPDRDQLIVDQQRVVRVREVGVARVVRHDDRLSEMHGFGDDQAEALGPV